MRQVHITVAPMEIDYREAMTLAKAVAGEDRDIPSPVLMSWYDRKLGRMSPDIAGADIHTRWHDYGESHEGRLEVDVGGDYAFIYADSSAFEGLGPSPYVNLHDRQGNEFICQVNMLADARTPSANACMPVDEWLSKQT